MPVKRAKLLLVVLALTLAACVAQEPRKIALLAPFEGQYREIGYNALYALRLAFADTAPPTAQLLAVDDGGSVEAATDRLQALNLDPAVQAIIALGPAATQPAAQKASQRPLILIGNWGHDRAAENSLYAAHKDLAGAGSAGDLLMLEQAQALQADSDSISFWSSGRLPPADFRARYENSAPYAPPPNLLATLTYDIGRFLLAASGDITSAAHQGINGLIDFRDGYWQAAPLNHFSYANGQLLQLAE